VEIKCQLDATEVFIADLFACSTCFGQHYAHHQGIKSIIQWLLPMVLRALVYRSLVWCGAEVYVSGLQDAAASCKPDTAQLRAHIVKLCRALSEDLCRKVVTNTRVRLQEVVFFIRKNFPTYED